MPEPQIILNLFLKYGEDAFSKINGPFSIVIFDANKKLLYGGRDMLVKDQCIFMTIANT